MFEPATRVKPQLDWRLGGVTNVSGEAARPVRALLDQDCSEQVGQKGPGWVACSSQAKPVS